MAPRVRVSALQAKVSEPRRLLGKKIMEAGILREAGSPMSPAGPGPSRATSAWSRTPYRRSRTGIAGALGRTLRRDYVRVNPIPAPQRHRAAARPACPLQP